MNVEDSLTMCMFWEWHGTVRYEMAREEPGAEGGGEEAGGNKAATRTGQAGGKGQDGKAI